MPRSSDRKYMLLPGWATFLFLSPIVFMFLWNWKVGIAWAVLLFACVREIPND